MGVRHTANVKKSENQLLDIMLKFMSIVSLRYRRTYFPSTVHLLVIVENDEWNLLKLVLCQLKHPINHLCDLSFQTPFPSLTIYIYIYIYKNDGEGNTKLLIQSNILMQMTSFRKLHFPFSNLPHWENMTDNVNI